MADPPAFDLPALLAGAASLQLPLDDSRLAQFDRYARLLIDWNQRVNLTAILDPRGIAVRHFLDSLSVALLWRPTRGARVVDVGAGAGFPGLVLKIVWPELALTLVEATGKKAAFLHQAVRELELGGVTVVAARAEEAAHRVELRERFDLALGRAVAPLPVLLELTLPFLAVGGRAIYHKAGDIAAERAAAERAIGKLGGSTIRVTPVPLPGLEGRWLVEAVKRWPTPAAYPRRPGVPKKQPLG